MLTTYRTGSTFTLNMSNMPAGQYQVKLYVVQPYDGDPPLSLGGN